MGLTKVKCLQGKQTKLIGLWKVEVGHKGICRLTAALIRIPNPNWELAEHKPFIFYVLMGFFTGVQKKKKPPPQQHGLRWGQCLLHCHQLL